MGSDDHIVSFEQDMVSKRRKQLLIVITTGKQLPLLSDRLFLFENIQSCTAHNPLVQRPEEGIGINETATGGVDEQRPALHFLELTFPDEVPGLRREWTVQCDHIGARKELVRV